MEKYLLLLVAAMIIMNTILVLKMVEVVMGQMLVVNPLLLMLGITSALAHVVFLTILTNVTTTMFTGMIPVELEKIKNRNVALVDGLMNIVVQAETNRENG